MSNKPRRIRRAVLIVLALGMVAIQFKPVDRTNPSVIETFTGPADLMPVLKRACWDCHSNETHWPWYSYVAPMSWFVESHVKEGREKLNFSDWSDDQADVEDVKRDVWKSVRKGEMPLPSYLWIHRDAALSDADKKIIEEWTKQ